MRKLLLGICALPFMCQIVLADSTTKIQCLVQNSVAKDAAIEAGIYSGELDPMFEIGKSSIKQISGIYKDDPYTIERFDENAILLRQGGLDLGPNSVLREYRMVFINRLTGDMNEVFQYRNAEGKGVFGEELSRLETLSGRDKTPFTRVKRSIGRYKCSKVEQRF